MNRRNFFKQLGIGAVTAVAVTHGLDLAAPVAKSTAYSTYVMGRNAVIGSYMDYCNFSSFAITTAIDEHVQFAAEELGRRAGMSYRFSFS
jgi:hypothetical protein